MPANLHEVSATGKTWTRCTSISIANPAVGTPSILFCEATVAEVGALKVEQISGTLQGAFNPADTIPLRDPETGDLTGDTVTQGYLYQVLYSLYMQKALERGQP